MGTLKSNLILGLIDNVSGPMRRLRGMFGGFRKDVGRLNSGGLAGLGMMRGALGAVGAYVGLTEGLSATVGAARETQAALTEIGIKSGQTESQLAQMQARLTKLGPKVNQTNKDLLGAVDTMVTMGLSVKDAEGAIPAIGKTATATMSSITDLSAASVAAMQNLKVAPTQIQSMLEGMTAAGNAGAFEMRDMATYFPQLTASVQALGMQGVPAVNDLAAALQIARRGAGDASTAANNLANFTGKIMAPETIKNFKKFGIDVTKELKKAHKQGISPIEHFVKLVNKATKGGQADLLGQLFGDKQVQDFLRPMLKDFDDYLRIRGEADRAQGVVAEAYQRRMQNADEKIKKLQISMQNLGTSIGANLLAPLGNVAEHFADIFNTLDQRATLFDKFRYALEGFTKGFGYKGGIGDLTKDLESFFFGTADASKAADEIGSVFKRFHEMGQQLRSLTDAFAGADTFSGKVRVFVAGMGELKTLFSAGSVLTFVATAFALKTLAGSLMLLGRSPLARIFLVAYGVSTLISAAQGSESIGEFVEALKGLSAMEWAGIVGMLLLVGSKVKRLIDLFRTLRQVTPQPGKNLPPEPVKPGNAPKAPAAGGGILRALGLGGLAGLAAGSMNLAQSDWFKSEWEKQRQDAIKKGVVDYFANQPRRESTGRAHLSTNDGGREQSLDDFLNGPALPKGGSNAISGPQSSVDVDAAKQTVQLAAQEMTNALQIKGNADIDTGGIDMAINKARTLLSLLQQAGSAASSIGSSRMDMSGLHADLSRAG